MLMRKAKKVEIFNLINAEADGDLGFDEDSLPDKPWLINVLKALLPKHEYFSHPDPEILREFPEE